MIKIENWDVVGWEHAIKGMRNPLNSHHKLDSRWRYDGVGADDEFEEDENNPVEEYADYGFYVGPNDHGLMTRLSKAGSVHRKYMRMITVYVDITCHHTWWSEFDTYKIATVRNSCSKMHKIHVKEFVKDDFSTEGIDECGGKTLEVFEIVKDELERLRNLFNETQEKKYWRAIIELLPMGFNIKSTVMLNYEVLSNMYYYRKKHKLDEWREFCAWIESLPFSELITGEERKCEGDE